MMKFNFTSIKSKPGMNANGIHKSKLSIKPANGSRFSFRLRRGEGKGKDSSGKNKRE